MIEERAIDEQRLVARWGPLSELAHLETSEIRPDLAIRCNGTEVDGVVGVDQPNGVLWALATNQSGRHYLTIDETGQLDVVRIKLEGRIEVKRR